MTIVIDATNAIAGRLAAFAAKKALQGEDVVLVNAGKAVVSGNAETTVVRYYKRRLQQNKADPDKSPKWPRRPDLMLKRIIKGMLPKQSSRRKHALSRVRAYLGVPKEFEGRATPFPANGSRLRCETISLEELCKKI